MQGTTYKYDTNSIGIIPKSDTDALYPNAMREALWKKRFSLKGMVLLANSCRA